MKANNNDTTYCTEPTYSYITINQLQYTHFTIDLHVTSLQFTSLYFTTLHSPFFTSPHFWTLRHHSSKTLHFSSHLITSVWKYVIYRGKPFVPLQAVGSTIWLSYLHRSLDRYLFFVTWILFYDRYHPGSDSTVLSPLAFHAFLRCSLSRGGQWEVYKCVLNRLPNNGSVFILTNRFHVV